MDPNPELDSELESFRKQWKTELRSKKPEAAAPRATRRGGPAVPSSSKAAPPRAEGPNPANKQYQVDDDEEYVKARSFDAPESISASGRTLVHPENEGKQELVSAMDHYEAAVEKEAIGSLGDSLKLYRKAFRIDHRVDLAYRKKHFAAQWQKPPASSQKPSQKQPAAPGAMAPTNAAEQQEQAAAPAGDVIAPSISDLIASFCGLAVSPAPAPVEGDPPPPCPMAGLPQEILTHIFTDVAVADVGDLARLALVCKRFTYLVATESQVWRRVCTGEEFGFTGMQYHWQTGISWEPFEVGKLGMVEIPLAQQDTADDNSNRDDGDDDDVAGEPETEYITISELTRRRGAEALSTTFALLPSYSSSWKSMFRHRPRIRFNGCYISTVNYIRAGQASVTSFATFGNPIHIVTYYRYLRFFRDGTAISLLTTSEPGDVVHHLTKPLLTLHQKKGERDRDRPVDAHVPQVPGTVMQYALRGRWRLSSAVDQRAVSLGGRVAGSDGRGRGAEGTPPPMSLRDSEGDLFVETEGVGEKYTNHMEMAMRSAGKGARNNKIAWKAFYSYNRLTDDWGEFALKNDKPFFFSRVRSYGVRGE